MDGADVRPITGGRSPCGQWNEMKYQKVIQAPAAVAG
jgi:hypothetical protein